MFAKAHASGLYCQGSILSLKLVRPPSFYRRLGMAAATQTVTFEQYATVIKKTFSNKGLKRLEALLETAKEPHPSWERKGKRVIPLKDSGHTVRCA